MAVHYIRPEISGGLRDPFDCDEQVVKALVTVGAFVALADGHVDSIERDQTVNYIDRQGLAPTISRQRIAEFFDARATSRKQRFRGFNCRRPATSSGPVTDLRCDSNCRIGRRGGSTRRS